MPTLRPEVAREEITRMLEVVIQLRDWGLGMQAASGIADLARLASEIQTEQLQKHLLGVLFRRDGLFVSGTLISKFLFVDGANDFSYRQRGHSGVGKEAGSGSVADNAAGVSVGSDQAGCSAHVYGVVRCHNARGGGGEGDASSVRVGGRWMYSRRRVFFEHDDRGNEALDGQAE